MQNIIYKSDKIIPWDTQSAFKIVSYKCQKEENMVFCYLKAYVKGHDLILCSYSFVKDPTGKKDLTLYLNLNPTESDDVLSIQYGFDGINDILFKNENFGNTLSENTVEYSPFKADDEQGFYWCGQVVIKKSEIEKLFSTTLDEKSIIGMNMVQNFSDGDFCVLCGDAESEGYLPEANLGTFVVLNY